MDTPCLIEAQNLVPAYEVNPPLPPLNCRLPASGTCCLIGLDGPGLDSYLRTLGGIHAPRSGELILFDKPLSEISPQQWPTLRTQLGYISRSAPLLSVLNGLENVILPWLYHSLGTRQQAEIQARALLEQLQFDGDSSLLPAYLSPLERTQLAIARAAILSPAVLLVDEPYDELELHQRTIIDGFLQHWGTQRALLVATRNLRFVRSYADQILFFGENGVHHFASWEMLCQSKEQEVRTYLQRYHDNYDL